MARNSSGVRRAKLSPALDHRLNLYSLSAVAAGVGFLALTVPAEAEVIYSPAYKAVQGTPVGATIPIDFNHDGVEDAHIRLIQFTTKGSSATFRTYGFLSVIGDNQNQILLKFGKAGAEPLGKPIGPGEPFGAGTKKMAYCDHDSVLGTPSTFFTYTSGSWVKVQNRYLGFKIFIQGQAHYAWARLTTFNQAAQCKSTDAVLTGYAYETVANKTIMAGATSDSPGTVPTDLPAGVDATSNDPAKPGNTSQRRSHGQNQQSVRTLGHLAAGVGQ